MHIEVHRASERGTTRTPWLLSRHSFSFNEWHNPSRDGFGALLVLNDDVIEPAGGFPQHGHKEMEIVTVVISGSLEHWDNAGNQGIVRAGDVQRMSAGTGIVHSEKNHSAHSQLRLLQLWIRPDKHSLPPGHEQRAFRTPRNTIQPIASYDGHEGSLLIHQDAVLLRGSIDEGVTLSHVPRNGIYAFVINGSAEIAGEQLGEGDAIAITGMHRLNITALQPLDILIIDVPVEKE